MPKKLEYQFRTQRKTPKLGLMLVGWGGNNGSTCTAGILANKHKMEWETKEGKHKANYFGSLTQASTCRCYASRFRPSPYVACMDGGLFSFSKSNTLKNL